MPPLFIDDFVRRQGFSTTEAYVLFSYRDQLPIWFKGWEYFPCLLQRGIIVPDYSSVRTRYTSGSDNSYAVTEDGRLEGLQLKAHSGQNGIFTPQELLSIEAAPDGWEVQTYRVPPNIK